MHLVVVVVVPRSVGDIVTQGRADFSLISTMARQEPVLLRRLPNLPSMPRRDVEEAVILDRGDLVRR